MVWHFSDFSTISYDFSKFTEKEKEKGFELLQKGSREVLKFLQSGPCPDLGRGTEEGGRISSRPVTGGEGRGARELEGVEANL